MPQSAEDVLRWVDEARAGSNEALGRLLDSFRAYLLTVAHGELGPDLEAKGGASDLVQETFLDAQRDFGRFRGKSEEELLGWLRQILLHNVHAFSRRYRQTTKRDVARERALAPGSDAAYRAPIDAFADSAPSPSELAISRERSVALRQALGRLSEDHRRVIVLRLDGNKSFDEIGHLMERSPGAVRKLWARAMEQLRQEWEHSQ